MARWWFMKSLGPEAILGSAFTAGWATWDNKPHEWEPNGRGWSKRFGVTMFDKFISTSVLVSSSRAFREDPRYFRCECTGAGARVMHAVGLTFRSRKPSGNYTFSAPKVLSPFVGPMVTRNTVFPDRFDSGDAAKAGAYFFGGNAAWNIFKEFFLKRH